MKNPFAILVALFLGLSASAFAQTIQEITEWSKETLAGICASVKQPPVDTIKYKSDDGGRSVKVGCKNGKPIWAISEELHSSDPMIYGDLNADGFVERLVRSENLVNLSPTQIDGINRLLMKPLSEYLPTTASSCAFMHGIKRLPDIQILLYDLKRNGQYSYDLYIVEVNGEWMTISGPRKSVIGDNAKTFVWTVNMNADLAFSLVHDNLKEQKQ